MKARIWISTIIIAILVWGVNSVSYSQEKTKEKAKTKVKTEKPIDKKSDVKSNEKKDSLTNVTKNNTGKKIDLTKKDMKDIKTTHHKMHMPTTDKSKAPSTDKKKETTTGKDKIN